MARPIALLALLLAAACAHYPVNPPQPQFDPAGGYRYGNVVDQPEQKELFVILSFSGGGTRAAALAYGVLEALRATPLPGGPAGRTLLDEVDVISSVSGGSFLSAYYALHGADTFGTFETQMLRRNIESALFWRVVNPLNWPRLWSGGFDRIDLAAEYYDAAIFAGATFADLVARDRPPFVVINATDMSLGARFEFTQDQFDLIGSDLQAFPLARAVAASSAFPGLLSPVRLHNHPQAAGYLEPEWVENALQDRTTAPDRHRRAVQTRSYLAGDGGGKRRPFLHLLDGGLSDNIGLRGVLTALTGSDGSWSLLGDMNDGLVQRVVVIAVDAKTEPAHDWDREESAPGLLDVLMTVATTPMDNYSTETVERVLEVFKEYEKDAGSVAATQQLIRQQFDPSFTVSAPHTPALHFVHVSFDDIADPAERARFKAMPTSFRLPETDIGDLRRMGGLLLQQAPAFQDLLAALAGG